LTDDHSHSHSAHSQTQGDNLKLAFFLNLAFTILEIFGGLWTNSLAILSDSLHDLGDSFSLGMAWYLERYSHRSEDNSYTYGYRRFSLVGALLNTIILLVGSIFIISEAIPRLFAPEHSNAQGMAVVGIAVNGFAVLRMRGEKGFNARVVAWHLLEDVLGWVAVLAVSIVLYFTDIHVLDPLLSILIALYILYNVARNLQKTLALFLQAVPEDMDPDAIGQSIEAMHGVDSTHHLHAWSLEGESHVLTMHVVVDESAPQRDVIALRKKIRKLLKGEDLEHVTIEIEYGPNDCMVA
jgi:cobalt-zinc-cadmium efflux system protein